MTTVRYDPDRYRLLVEGHAGSAPAGEDLVCAAASILGWTLVANAERYNAEIFLENGVIEVKCAPEDGREALCREMMDTLATGFKLLAEKQQEYITMGGDTNGL